MRISLKSMNVPQVAGGAINEQYLIFFLSWLPFVALI